jgi:polysaccharide export outer membrane protein
MGSSQVSLKSFRVCVTALTPLAAMLVLGIATEAREPQAAGQGTSLSNRYQQTTEDYNRRLVELNRSVSGESPIATPSDYRIGADDLLDISVLEASELDRAPRVSASGQISLAVVGTVRAAGLTTQELSAVIEEILRRNYIKNPHVTVQVREMQSHSVSVFGAVRKPGVFQIRGPKSVIELLSMAEGLGDDAGDTVIVDRHDEIRGFWSAKAAGLPVQETTPSLGAVADGGFNDTAVSRTDQWSQSSGTRSGGNSAAEPGSSETVEIDLKKLLDSGDASLNVEVYPGDVVKVTRAELVYVVGEVAKPGGFQLKSNENISVLQAVALAQGLTHTSAAAHSKIIRTDPATGQRQEIPIDLKKVLAGKVADPMLTARDIVFVPNSVGRTAMYRSLDAMISVGTGLAVYRW